MNKRNGVRATAAVAGVAAVLAVSACGGSDSTTITGEGSTAQQKAMEHFGNILTEKGGAVLDYTGSGSGDGIKKFLASDVDFAGSDSPLKPEEAEKAKVRCGGNDAWHLPLVAGPVALAYNLPGVEDLKLSPTVIARIFDSKITSWDDKAIADLNPGVKLPATRIVPVHRSDSSGTTDNFQKFLKLAAPQAWPYEPSKEFKGTGGSAASKSTGVGEAVKKTEGSVTYVEWGFATENDLGVAAIDFGSGAVKLTAESAGKALDSVTFKNPGSKDLVVDADALFKSKAAGAYPLILTPYSVVCSAGYADATTAPALREAFSTILADGQKGLTEIGYVPLPAGYQAKLKPTIDALK